MPSSPTRRRVKVLWLIKGLGPGGAEQLLLLSAKVADHDAFDYRIAYLRPDKTHLIPEFQALGLTPTRLGSRHTGRLGWLADLRTLLGEVDVVHSHSPVLASVARLLTPLRELGLVVSERRAQELRLSVGGPLVIDLVEAVCGWLHPAEGGRTASGTEN